MNTIHIYQLKDLSSTQMQRLRKAHLEAARVWNVCMQTHKEARLTHEKWPTRNELQKLTKGRFQLHSQSVQMVVHAFLANIDTTLQLRQTHPNMRIRYPHKEKTFYPVHWPAQAISKEYGRVVLPMGRGRTSIVLSLDLPHNSGACTLVWNNGYELHVCVQVEQAETAPGTAQATVDLGEIHLAAVTTDTNKAMIVTGRGIRTLKRQRTMQLRNITKKQSQCTKYLRRWKKLQRAKHKQNKRARNCIRNQRHQATRKVINFCIKHEVGTLFIGNPHGVRNHKSGRHHNQRISLWEYGKDIDYLTYKAKQAHISSFTGSERGTSSQCPSCGINISRTIGNGAVSNVVSMGIETL